MLLILLPLTCFGNQNAVSFKSWGRLGDQILDYAHAKWISYKYGIPLLYKPFEYSDQLVLHDVEEHLTQEKSKLYQHITLKTLSELEKPTSKPTLFFVTHFPDSFDEYLFIRWKSLYVHVDWNDQKFLSMMRKLIKPKQPLKLIHPPKEIISVALHYRNGGGFIYDTDSMKKQLPLRFPADEYYFEQLTTLCHLVNDAPLYIYIFTDHPNPLELKKMFRIRFPSENIQFHCRAKDNKHDKNVLVDVFSMMNFDCIIRPVSHFSLIASHLGNFKIELCPKSGHWEENKTKFIVDEVNVTQKASWDQKQKKWLPLKRNANI